MAGHRSYDPRDREAARAESLLTEQRIVSELERLLALPPDKFQKLPSRQREHLHRYRKEARLP